MSCLLAPLDRCLLSHLICLCVLSFFCTSLQCNTKMQAHMYATMHFKFPIRGRYSQRLMGFAYEFETMHINGVGTPLTLSGAVWGLSEFFHGQVQSIYTSPPCPVPASLHLSSLCGLEKWWNPSSRAKTILELEHSYGEITSGSSL